MRPGERYSVRIKLASDGEVSEVPAWATSVPGLAIIQPPGVHEVEMWGVVHVRSGLHLMAWTGSPEQAARFAGELARFDWTLSVDALRAAHPDVEDAVPETAKRLRMASKGLVAERGDWGDI